jgi:chemosensory pili system protein ChpA (sensor histidine kinase/response regulator)
MSRTVDPEVLAGFLEEVRGYLPSLAAGIEAAHDSPGRERGLVEAHRQAHCIKGAAAMVGLDDVSRLADRMEEAFEDAATGARPLDEPVRQALRAAAALLERRVAGAHAPPEEVEQVLARLPSRRENTESLQTDCHFTADAAQSPNRAGNADDGDAELAVIFRVEAEEHLKTLRSTLPILREGANDPAVVQQLRRSAHTLKGSAAMVGRRDATRLAHRMEDYLDLLYDGRPLVADGLALLHASVDGLDDLTAGLGGVDLPRLLSQYDRLLGAAAPAPSPNHGASAPAPANGAAGAETFVRVPLPRLEEVVRLVSELAIERSALEERFRDAARQAGELQRSAERLGRVTAKLEAQFEASALGGRLASLGSGGSFGGFSPATWETHGFDELEFDRYTDFHLLTRELAEAATDVASIGQEIGGLGGACESAFHRQSQLTSDVQERLRRVRLAPFGSLAARLKRTVRGVAEATGKRMELVLEGESVELDKAMLEDLVEPLLHLLRNAAGHGIEPPEVRAARRKPEAGRVAVRAAYAGAQVVVTVEDDGGGVDLEAVRARAVAAGAASPTEAAGLSEADLLDLIFQPGVSTAAAVSETSGRGVGLDVVRSRVAKLQGAVDAATRPGAGTTFTVRLPMTLAVMRALLVESCGRVFAVPFAAVNRIVRMGSEAAEAAVDGASMSIGDLQYPRIDLGDALGLSRDATPPPERPPVLLIDVGVGRAALVVDRLLGGREVVVKSLGPMLRRVHGVSGVTVLGDGALVPIVNPIDLAHPPRRSGPRVTALPRPVERTPTALVVDDSPSVRRVMTSLLTKAGWAVAAARDGAEALEMLEAAAAPPDVVLTDIEMPRMDGYELLAALKGRGEGAGLPVVMITSRTGAKHRRKALDLGADAYFSKPYREEELLAALRRLARRSA